MFYKEEKVVHFGLWAEERADINGAGQAMALIRSLVAQCDERDITAEIEPALEYLSFGNYKRVNQLRQILKIERPDERLHAAQQLLRIF